MTEADLIVRDIRGPEGQSGWWAAKCKHCGAWISKFDTSREECIQNALGKPEHICNLPGQLGLL